jgi:predicted dehydrogenase
MMRIAVIGQGHWGPNLLRNFESFRDCQVTMVCDRDGGRLQGICQKFPSVHATTDANEVFNGNGKIDAVVIATPARTHYALAKQALERGYHAFVEKPLATSSDECEQLIELADRKKLILFVGHVFLYSAPVAKLVELVLNGDLGDLYYISSRRLNLGPVRQDVSALWDLAPHDVYIMLELMGAMPTAVSCTGLACLHDSLHDVCSITLHFEGKKMGLLHVSWLDPHKSRVMTVVGSRRMAIYNDIDPLEKIKVYDRGIDVPPYTDSFGEFQLSYRYGDTYSPRVVEQEPLKAECRSFVESIVEGTSPRTDGHNGLQVVQVIEAAERSLERGGREVEVERSTHDGNGPNGPRGIARVNGLPASSQSASDAAR